MDGSADQLKLDTCGCCEAESDKPERKNRPGLNEIKFRVGTHPLFFEWMKNRIHSWEIPDGRRKGDRPLSALTSRETSDPALAFMDSWAVVSDVLTFYQERIANEGFLRTATERRSILELARAIGYELGPGVAAQTYLAFTVDDSEGMPLEVSVPKGTQIQSIPSKEGELPQVFETNESFVAKAELNELRPKMTRSQKITVESNEVYLKGADLNLSTGDRMLLTFEDDKGQVLLTQQKTVRKVEPDPKNDYTLVIFENTPNPNSGNPKPPSELAAADSKESSDVQTTMHQTYGPFAGVNMAFNAFNINQLLALNLTEIQLQAILIMNNWSVKDFLNYMHAISSLVPAGNTRVYVFRESVGIFGNNAPRYLSLPEEIRGTNNGTGKAYPYNWDKFEMDVWTDSITNDKYDKNDPYLYLERQVKGIMKDSWILLECPGGSKPFKIVQTNDGSISGFGMSAKVTGLRLLDMDLNRIEIPPKFTVRESMAYVKSEEVKLTSVPRKGPIQSKSRELQLNCSVHSLLRKGQPVSISGELVNTLGTKKIELKIVESITNNGTTIRFTEGIDNDYKRDTLIINGNVVAASHGESVKNEVLGGGDSSKTNQRFTLKKPPLTHVAASSAIGSESTLTIRVDGIKWDKANSLYELSDSNNNYIIRIDNDANARIIFGDGKHGARLPTGLENVVATYRSGIGFEGEVDIGRLTLFKKRPFGIREVTNPIKADGADNPEKMEDARINAPLEVLTFERIVSLQDYEDYARAYEGIGKAQAVSIWNGENEVVHITVADANGGQVTKDLKGRLLQAIEKIRDPSRKVEIETFQPQVFAVGAKVLINEKLVWEKVKNEIELALKEIFSFSNRAFGQAVTAAEVISTIHSIDGVKAVDLDYLYKVLLDSQPKTANLMNAVLDSRIARYEKSTNEILLAQLLLIHPSGIELSEMKS